MQDRWGVIFDMDGVLVDSYVPHFVSWQETAVQYGLNLSEEQFRNTFGQTSGSIIRQLWGAGALNAAQMVEFDRIKEARYRELVLTHLPIMEGARELVTGLRACGVSLAIGSSGPPENVQLVAEELGGTATFSAVVTGRDVTAGKPDPQVFLMAAQKLGLSPDRCLVIEDAPVGVEAACRAGIRAVGIQSPSPRSRDLSAATLVVNSLGELSPALLQSLLDLS